MAATPSDRKRAIRNALRNLRTLLGVERPKNGPAAESRPEKPGRRKTGWERCEPAPGVCRSLADQLAVTYGRNGKPQAVSESYERHMLWLAEN